MQSSKSLIHLGLLHIPNINNSSMVWSCPLPLDIAGSSTHLFYFLLLNGIQEEPKANLEYFKSSEIIKEIPS